MKVPYKMIAAMSLEERHAQMFHAIQQGYPRLVRQPINEGMRMSLACYGPSLQDTWQDLTPPILSMSGATRFLADRGIIADYHLDMDPRSHKAKHLDPPIEGVHYLMASVCPPATWTQLKGQQVTLWHTYSGRNERGYSTFDWVNTHDPGGEVIHGGSTIGLTAFHVGGLLGCRHFEVHGMDGSYADETRTLRHAGPHYGHTHKDEITWDAEGHRYHTSKIMANAVAETLQTMKTYPMFCVFHGRGLTQALIRELNVENACTAEQTEKASVIRRAVATMIHPLDRPRYSTPWEVFLANPKPEWISDLQAAFAHNETLRAKARYNTGAVGLETALLLRAMCCSYAPKVIVEVGTFIGNSTAALAASEHLYTCDRDNDCLSSTDRRTCFPYQTSAQMFAHLAARGVTADFVFLDGRLTDQDVPLLMKIVHPRTVYAFDDFTGKQKGIVNVARLRPLLPSHVLLEPYAAFKGRTTLAAMLPLGAK